MQKRILAFLYDEDHRHIERFISKSISKVAKYYGIKRKVICIAFDNASNNNAADELLKVELSPSLPKIFHVKCTCHLYNLIVRDGPNFFELSIEKVRLDVNFIQ